MLRARVCGFHLDVDCVADRQRAGPFQKDACRPVS